MTTEAHDDSERLQPLGLASTDLLGVDAAHELERRGYELKHTHRVGFWVDGRCCYMVSGGYFDTAQRACETAWERVQEAEAKGSEPAWKFPTPNAEVRRTQRPEENDND